MPQKHGIPGQLNVYYRDTETDITSFGKHKRVVIFLDPPTGHIQARVDQVDVEGDDQLPWPTLQQVMRVARGFQRMHPRGTVLRHRLIEGQEYQEGQTIALPCRWYEFEAVSIKRLQRQRRHVARAI